VVKIRKEAQGKNYAELSRIYFCMIKFSTQMLISMWKIASGCQLTSLASMGFSCLHNFSAMHFYWKIFQRHEKESFTSVSRQWTERRVQVENFSSDAPFLPRLPAFESI
jgi:hypothetical protein